VVIERGRTWGEPGVLRAGDPVAHSDAELRRFIEMARQTGRPVGRVGLLGGDLCRTVGGPGDPDRLRAGGSVLPVDAARAVIDGEPHWFCAHLVARRWGWLGRFAVVMNAQWFSSRRLGSLRLGPRAHPNDGLLDVTDGTLPARDLLKARVRARTGIHLPHPHLKATRTARIDLHFDRPVGIWLDGERVARRARSVVVDLEPDAGEVVV
jgi:hypothetical protein